MSTCSMLVSRFSTEQRLEASHSCNPQFVEVHLTQGILQCLKRIYLMFPLLCVWIILIPRDLKIWVVDSSQFPRFGFSYKMMLSSMVKGAGGGGEPSYFPKMNFKSAFESVVHPNNWLVLKWIPSTASLWLLPFPELDPTIVSQVQDWGM